MSGGIVPQVSKSDQIWPHGGPWGPGVVRSGLKLSKSPGIPHGDDFPTLMYSGVVFVLSCSVLSTLLGDFGPRRAAARGGLGPRRFRPARRPASCLWVLVAPARFRGCLCWSESIEDAESFPKHPGSPSNSSNSATYEQNGAKVAYATHAGGAGAAKCSTLRPSCSK